MKEMTSRVKRSYPGLLTGVIDALERARRYSARSVNVIMTATYWEIGHLIVEHEQHGEKRASYGDVLLKKLAADLTTRYGRGFSRTNLQQMREFYLSWPIRQTLSGKSVSPLSSVDASVNPRSISAKVETERLLSSGDRKRQTESGKSSVAEAQSSPRFPLPWSHYVRLLSVKSREARGFYEREALRGGWSVRQLDRQISAQFYERTALSRNRAALMRKGQRSLPEDRLTAEEEIKDPLVLEFLGLKDEYSESALEEALIQRLEQFLLELGNDFAFIARQKRLRVGDEWYRVDLMFFHRRLRCLVIVDLKIGKFTHSDAGQMNLYLNYAREHWTLADENPPIGLILSSEKNEAVAHYALGNLQNKVLSSEYKLALPDEKRLAEEMAKIRKALQE
jgi:predicted nuclease of restriction endonuclease-like (RecB) superfamily